MRATVGRTDAQMGAEWKWNDDYDEEGLRFALLMTHHELRDLAVRLAAQRPTRTQAQAILAQYHQAYRDLTGVLACVGTDDLDRAPAEGEWNAHEMLQHMIGAEWGFLAVDRFGLARHRAGNDAEPTDAEFKAFQAPYREQRTAAEATVLSGTIADVRNAFFEVHVRVLRELGDIADAELEAPAWFWEDVAMPIRFRLHRFEEHLRQHTIQLDKTLTAIGRGPTEAHRLVRNIYNALADVESERAPADELRQSVAEAIVSRVSTIPS